MLSTFLSRKNQASGEAGEKAGILAGPHKKTAVTEVAVNPTGSVTAADSCPAAYDPPLVKCTANQLTSAILLSTRISARALNAPESAFLVR